MEALRLAVFASRYLIKSAAGIKLAISFLHAVCLMKIHSREEIEGGRVDISKIRH